MAIAALVALAGCPLIDLAPPNVFACASAADCPSGGPCANGLCAADGGPTDGGAPGDGGPLTRGSPCSPAPFAADDACAESGLVCCGVTLAASCGLPLELEPCAPSSGCAPGLGLACETLSNGALGPESICIQPCNATPDCLDPLDVCGDGGYCLRTSCGGYYGSCGVEAPGDGFCLPFSVGATTSGSCLEGGALAPGATGCLPTRSQGGAQRACEPGSKCALPPGGDGGFVCARLCDPSGQGIACPAGQSCIARPPECTPPSAPRYGLCAG
ncbi:MAG: hypothetical protein ACYCWW_05960 [Deltaproteobacteria bacterium]